MYQGNYTSDDVGVDLFIGNLSKDVFERRTSTGSELFSFLSGILAHTFGQIVSMIRKRFRIKHKFGIVKSFKMKRILLLEEIL